MTEKLTRLLEREGTGISWADLTFNPWIGCQKTGSPACENCYAEGLATTRLGVQWGPHAERRRTAPGNWSKPPRWQRIAAEAGVRLNVFCASLADVFDNKSPPGARDDLARLIESTPNLIWMLLTKRVGNARAMLESMFPGGVPENVALGVTIVTQEEADRDMPRALAVKAGLGIKRLFVSMEPLMGYVDMTRYLAGVDLIIVGGESGRQARPMPDVWVDAIQARCRQARVAFHFKQQSQADHPRTYGDPATFPPPPPSQGALRMTDTPTTETYDAHETLKPKEPPFTVQGGDPIGPWTVQFWADAARATARAILDGTQLRRPNVEFATTDPDPTFEPSEADKVAADVWLRKATSAEQVGWSMMEYQRGQQSAPEQGAPDPDAEPEVVLESRSVLIRQVGRLNNAVGIAKEVEEALVALDMLAPEQAAILNAIGQLQACAAAIDPRKAGERS